MALRKVQPDPEPEPEEVQAPPAEGLYASADVVDGALSEGAQPQTLANLSVQHSNAVVYLVGADGVPQRRELRSDGNLIIPPQRTRAQG